jgi:MoxR-like ATPase
MVKNVQEPAERVVANVERVIIGKHVEVRMALVALLCEGHILIEDVPGVGKTMLAKALSKSIGCSFRRIQFTPDLLPSDVTGLSIFNQKTQEFEFRPGPIMAQVVLADEINRATPKTQSALLECMEERQATVDGTTYQMPDPFIVIATQNPIEYEGTYPLPEAELDRFLFKVRVGYPDPADEALIVRMHDQGKDPHDVAGLGVRRVAGREDLAAGSREVTAVTVTDDVVRYIVTLAGETRISPSILLGASPRGSAMLVRAAKATAYLQGRDFVTPDDVKSAVKPCWRHRLALRPEVELEGATTDSVLDGLVARVPVPA